VTTITSRFPRKRPAALGLLLAACALGSSGFGLSAALHPVALANPDGRASTEGEERYDGEYGLFVQISDSDFTVAWITAETGPGHLKVVEDGGPLSEHETPSGVSHHVTIPRPEAGAAVLEYGGPPGSADRHTTTIYLDTPDSAPEPIFSGVDSLYVVGDTHGRFDTVTELLVNA